jgi:Mce-associated membrane protein
MVAMADPNERPTDSAEAQADAMALAEQAEAEAAEAEALAAAARARARAIRLRREAEAKAVSEEPDTPPVEDADTTVETGEVTDSKDGDENDQPPAPVPASAARRRWLRRPPVSAIAKVAAIIVTCGFLVVSGIMVWHHHGAIQQRQRSAAFAAGARQGVINMTSLDFKKAKEDVQRVLDSSTGEFRDDFQQRAADFTSVVEQSKVVTEGTVNSTAVESMGKDSAVVLVSATSHVTNSAGAKEEPRAWRLRVTVTDDAGQLKMSKVEFVP